MESIKFYLNKKENPLLKDLTKNRLKKNNKIFISKYNNEDYNSVKIRTSSEKFKKIQKEKNLSGNKNSILKHIKVSEDSKRLIRKNINKNIIYDLGNLINNLKSIKSYSINIKQKHNKIITNINDNKTNKNNNRNNVAHSIDRLNKKTIEKERDLNNNDFHLSCKTFNLNNNNNGISLNEQIMNHRNKIFKKKSHDFHHNNDNNSDIDNLINKFKQYKIINKNIQKNNININLNINNIQNIQNIETIDINKINPNQKLFFIKNDILHSYMNCGKTYNDKIPQDNRFKTLQNYSHEKRLTNDNFSPNINTNRNEYNSSNIKPKLNSIRDNLFNNKLNKGKKNIKLNYNILVNKTNITNQDYLPKFSSFDTINNNKTNINLKNNYNNNLYNNYDDFSHEFFDNKTINNESIKNKKSYFRVLTGKKKKFISFGEVIKKENHFNNIDIKNNNIILKLSKSKIKNSKIILPKNINTNINYKSNNNKPKNFFNHKNMKIDTQRQINNNFYTIIPKTNNNNINTINLSNSPHDSGLKLIIKNKKKHINENIYINSKPEYVKEYNDEILINLLIEEFTFNKKKKVVLNSDIINSYGINPTIRSYLIDSLVGLQDTFKFCDKTLFITIQIFDNYLGSIIASNDPDVKIEETDLDIIIVSCFLIASKMEESFIYHLTDYLSILSDKYNTNHIMNMEYNILKYYNFEAFEPNTLDFFEIFSSLYNLDDISRQKGIKILLTILLNIDLSQMHASVISFSVFYLMIKKDFKTMMDKIDSLFYNLYKWSDWSQKNYSDKMKNETYSKYMKLISPLKNENEIKEISDMILYFVENIPKNEFINIAKKLEK